MMSGSLGLGSGQPPGSEFDPRISLQKLEVLCLVVELGGVTRAAEHLHVVQPVVTAHIRSLERRLGVTLFSRQGRRLELTEAGREVHRWAAEALSRTRTMLRVVGEIEDGSRGMVSVAASMSVGSYALPEVLTEFRRARPRVQLSLTIREPEGVVQMVEQGVCDFGITILEEPPGNDALSAERLVDEEIVLVAAPNGPPHACAVTLDDLRELPLIAPPDGTARRRLIDRALAATGARLPDSILDLGHPEAMKRAARSGIGATFLFRSAVREDLARGDLREVPIRNLSVTVPIYALRRNVQALSQVQGQLLAVIRARLRETLTPEGR